MLLSVVKGRGDQLEGDELKSAIFKALDNFADQAALHGIWLEHDVTALRSVGESNGATSDTGCRSYCDRACCPCLEERAAGELRHAGDEGRHSGFGV